VTRVGLLGGDENKLGVEPLLEWAVLDVLPVPLDGARTAPLGLKAGLVSRPCLPEGGAAPLHRDLRAVPVLGYPLGRRLAGFLHADMVGGLGVEAAEGLVAEFPEAAGHALDLGAEGLGLHADDQEEAFAVLIADLDLASGRERETANQLIRQVGALGIGVAHGRIPLFATRGLSEDAGHPTGVVRSPGRRAHVWV
jgi:hypothetical protein